MTYHEWSDWMDPAKPVTGPAIRWDRIDTFVLHYTAAINLPDGDFGESLNDLPGYMRRIQAEYLRRKPTGYSIGYNEAADWLGGIWKGRGTEIRCAANAGHNEHTFAMLMLVDGQDEATPECVAAVRQRYGYACARAGKARGRRWYQLAMVGHQNLTPTGCPGTGVMRQMRRGEYMITEEEYFASPMPSPPAPQPPSQEDRMKIQVMCPVGSYAVFLGTCDPVSQISLSVRWSGPGTPAVNAAIEAHIAAGAIDRRVHNRPPLEAFKNVWLDGPLPHGDVRQWSASDFAGVG